ncbi:hypothetical protein PLICRDRAFT_106619 [Plicaturopsis crispa FD-325 SS-3]|nr:hypothetical protein PLICRDRAFT_106619 [Plicaturopsis crispa FD-325 SS-3]
MDRDSFSTPPNQIRSNARPSRSTAAKRDSLQAELDRDPQLSTAKRQQRSQTLTSHMAHASLERQLLTVQTMKTELESKLREKDVLIERLERDRRWLAERETKEREEKERERAEAQEDKRKADEALRSARDALASLQQEHEDLDDAHSSLSRSTHQIIASQKSQIYTLTRQVSALEAELVEVKLLADERGQSIRAMQEKLDDLSTAQDITSRKSLEEDTWAVVRTELHKQAEYHRQLESVNAKQNAELAVLRERHASVEVLREEKRALERKVSTMEALRNKVAQLEAEVEAGRRERQEWSVKFTSSASKTPVSVTRNLSALRLTHARLLEDHGANVALLRTREAELADAERREAESRTEINELQVALRSLKEKLQRREHRTVLAEREVGFLQALVSSFSAEEEAAGTESADVAKAKVQRLQELETLLEEYKATNKALEKEIDAFGGDAGTLGTGKSRKELSQEVEEARLSLALKEAEQVSEQQLERIDELEQTLFDLQGDIASGNHVPPGRRILCLQDNPAQQWEDLSRAAMTQLRGENEALMNRLKELEQSGYKGGSGEASGGELVPRESWDIVNKEKGELEEVVKQKEKRLLRLQQVFKAKSAEFREAIATILGVKLAFYPNGQVRCTSIYDLNASFIFQPQSGAAATGEGMKMQLVAQSEGGPEELPQIMRNWVEEEQCIPCFLASVTLECYDKMKREEAEQALAQ